MKDEAPLPLSLIAHTAFCGRRAWLEAQGERVENLNMERGEHDHQRVDTRKDERQATHRSVEVHSSTLGLTGRCDVVRSDSHGLTVVEYKAAPVAEVPMSRLLNERSWHSKGCAWRNGGSKLPTTPCTSRPPAVR